MARAVSRLPPRRWPARVHALAHRAIMQAPPREPRERTLFGVSSSRLLYASFALAVGAELYILAKYFVQRRYEEAPTRTDQTPFRF